MRERFQTILVAYLAASLASAFALLLGLSLTMFLGLLFEGRWQAAGSAALASNIGSLMLGGWVSFFVMILALVPAVIVIGVAEAARVRAAAFYGGAGTIAAIVCWGVFSRKDGEWFRMPDPTLASSIDWVVVGAAGLIGGLVYWSIAGRSAGDRSIPERRQP